MTQAETTVVTTPASQSRLLQLDVLRGVAILLVLGRHPAMEPHSTSLLGRFAAAWFRLGWTGVDLFFVLSGFLVGGLLFKELITHSHLDVRRFLIRRGLKIWPAYFTFLTFLSVEEWIRAPGGSPIQGLNAVLPNWVHLQNYLGTPRGHTWSLAVEEHFYLALPLLLLALTRGRKRPLTAIPAIPWIALFLVLACTGLRYFAQAHVPATDHDFASYTFIYWTHTRIDGLFFGVLLAYLYHFKPQSLRLVAQRPGAFLLLGLLLIAPMARLELRTAFVSVAGITCLYLAYGSILLALLYTPLGAGSLGRLLQSPPARAVALLGYYSYSIYLWHVDLAQLPIERLSALFGRALPLDIAWLVGMSIELFFAIGLGVVLARLIEMRALRVRDRLIPTRTPSLAADEEPLLAAEPPAPRSPASRIA